MTGRLWKAAFVSSLPVLMGYTTMGMAAGILLARNGGISHAPAWGFLTSLTSISGALQFILVEWARNRTAFLTVALLTFCLNIRYAMYGLSLLERFHGIGIWRKLYLIWTLTDETYALEVENKHPDGESSLSYCLLVAALDHLYWVAGVFAGALIGAALPFQTKGIDFAMTALFLVILTDQCRDKANRLPAAVGIVSALVARLFFSTDNMIIPTMCLMLAAFLICRRRLEPAEEEASR